MPRYVALLRAVNLGPRNQIAMADLRSLAEKLGHTDVSTYIASGNLLFASPERAAAKVRAALEGAVEAHMGKPILVLVRTPAQMRALAARKEFDGLASPDTRLNVTFLDKLPAAPLPKATPDGGLEVLAVVGSDVLTLMRPVRGRFGNPNAALEKAGARGTTRNWNVVRALAERAAGLAPKE